MFCMRVGMMAMAMVMGVVSMRMRVMRTPQRNWDTIGLTSTSAFELTQIAAIGQSLHMVMVAGLG